VLIVTIRNKGRLDAILPLRTVPMPAGDLQPNPYPSILKAMPAVALQGLINSHTRFTSILVRQGSEAFAKVGIARALASIKWQSIDLGLLPSGSPLSRVLDAALGAVSVPTGRVMQPDTVVRFEGSFQNFLDRKPSLRKAIAHASRSLEEF